jgi:hypothetical protein
MKNKIIFQLSESDYKLINDKCDEAVRWLDANQVSFFVTSSQNVTFYRSLSDNFKYVTTSQNIFYFKFCHKIFLFTTEQQNVLNLSHCDIFLTL